ncbi:MAG: HAMP domain-containing protein, partial [Nitrospirae bacterium]
ADIKEINIYSHPEGLVKFSSKTSLINSSANRSSPACLSCHKQGGTTNKPDWIKEKRDGSPFVSLSITIPNKPQCFNASCHVHPPEKKLIGVLQTGFSLKALDERMKEQKIITLLSGGIFTLFFCVILCIVLWRLVVGPLYILADGLQRVSRGELDFQIELDRKDEMGMLARAFNSMTRELKTSRQRLENWAKELEQEVAKKTEEIKKGQEQLVHTEKLASLGRMAAGVAHELNSPLTGIVTFAHLMLKRLPPENKMDREDLEVIIEQAERCSKIIKGLLGFSRALPSEKTDVNINNVISHTVGIVRNQAKFHNVKIKTELTPNLPDIRGDASQLEQVFMNLLINAADAMNDRGSITIATRITNVDGNDYVEIEFTDTGPGIPEEYMDRLFEPFFTTKPPGKGTGLGLSVSHGIVKKHGGHIRVKSTPGKGTTFLIRLPVPSEKQTES